MKNKLKAIVEFMQSKFKRTVSSIGKAGQDELATDASKQSKRRARGLSTKIIGTVIALLIVALPVMIYVTLLQVKEISNDKQEMSAKDVGYQFSNSFRTMEAEQLSAMRAFTGTVGLLREQHLGREQLILVLERFMQANAQTNYVNIMFAPNKYDGLDSEYIHSNLYGSYENDGQFGLSIIKSSKSFIYTSLNNLDFYTSTEKLNAIHRSEPINMGSEINPILYISLNTPIHDSDGNFIGAMGVLMPLNDIQTLTTQFTNKNSSVSLISEAGTYVTHANSEKLNKPYDYMDQLQSIKSGELVETERVIDGEKYLVQFVSLPFADTDSNWTIEISTKLSSINSEYTKSRNIAFMLCFVTIILLSTLIILALRRWVFKPIKAINTHLTYIANGDLTKRLEFKSKDEFSEIANSYNLASESLRHVLSNVSELSLNVSATSEQMTASAQHTAKASENITLAIEQVSQSADTQFKEIKHTNAQISEMMDGISRITESVSTASGSASNAEQQTVNGQVKMKATIDQMENVQVTVNKSNEAMNVLNEKANEINKIVVLIETLSKQTNLLALNAAIEAARAGEAGKGFNVVANEIRHLSEQTKTATNQITDLINIVQENISNASEAMLLGASDVMKTVSTVNETGQLFEVIRAEVVQVHAQISEVSAAAEQLQASSTTVNDAAVNISNLSQETMSNSNEVAASSEEQLATMQEMATSAESLSHMVAELTEKMSKFKI